MGITQTTSDADNGIVRYYIRPIKIRYHHLSGPASLMQDLSSQLAASAIESSRSNYKFDINKTRSKTTKPETNETNFTNPRDH